MVKAKVYLLNKRYSGLPQEDDFKLIEKELPPLKDGEFLCEAEYLSVDPYMRVYTAEQELGTTMIGGQVAKIIDSKNTDFPIGKHCFGYFGWKSHTIANNNKTGNSKQMPPYIIPELKEYPMSLYLGVLGMPGNTAYFGFMDICKPKSGETVVISGAAGAVGSHVGQIAKLKGCKVIGLAGSNEKGEWLKSIGFDSFINYKTTENLRKDLRAIAPQGIDCYFDNVGGEMSSTIINRMNKFGRVAVCGSIAAYNEGVAPKATILQPAIVSQQLTIIGLHASNYGDRWMAGIKQNKEWLDQGKLHYKEHVVEGFENMVKAFKGLFTGDNTGKTIVKVIRSLKNMPK